MATKAHSCQLPGGFGVLWLAVVTYASASAPRMHCTSQGSAGVLELASSTLAMFSSRPGAGAAFAEAGTANVLIKLLSPLFPPVVVINICNNVGNMAGAPGLGARP
jgi:hypothetical protein